MNTELQLFTYSNHEVRTVMIDGEPWVVAKDVCDVLEIQDVSNAVKSLDDDEVNTHSMRVDGGRPMLVVSESGVYSLVLRSRKPEAKAFKRFITHEVLPSLRKTGQYAITDKAMVTTREKCEALQLLQYQARVNRELAKKGLYQNWVTGDVLPLPEGGAIPDGLEERVAVKLAKRLPTATEVARLVHRMEDDQWEKR
jgi:prophage antirepressor-like protein